MTHALLKLECCSQIWAMNTGARIKLWFFPEEEI